MVAAAVVLLLCQRLQDTERSLFVRNWPKGIGLVLPLLFFCEGSELSVHTTIVHFFL
jgi:hypothetical protein